MKIDEIMHFEKQNNLRIDLFGIEASSIYHLYVSLNGANNEFKSIFLVFIGDRKAIITIKIYISKPF